MKTRFYLLAAALVALSSCIKDKEEKIVKNYSDEEYSTITKALNLPVETQDYTLDLPSHLGGFPVSVSNHEATLGRVLFYDKRLSVNKEVNCASCHHADKAFTDGEQFSQGVTTERTSRNTLALGSFPSFNAYYGFGGTRMFWDNRAASVMEQAEETMKNPVEMGIEDLSEVVDELLNEDYYQILFKKAFPNADWLSDEEKMLQALQTFVSSIGCFDTRYDDDLARSNPGADFPNFTEQENLGKQLFNTNCVSCHNLGAGFATTIVAANNGLDTDYEDEGMGAISNKSGDNGVFKVPMLRNIELTGPYMHDGRFATLEAVVEHYSTGVQIHPNLHDNLRTEPGGLPKKLDLNESEKQALVAFLETLTDRKSLAHVRYSDPFK